MLDTTRFRLPATLTALIIGLTLALVSLTAVIGTPAHAQVDPPCTIDAECDDGLFCNGAETCDPVAGCQAGAPVDCSDGIACTADACSNSAGACLNMPVDMVCDDGDVCTGAETCEAGTGCVAGTALDCDDDNSCTDDSCYAVQGCVNPVAADGSQCDDGDVCNGVQTCQAGACTAGPAPTCDDGLFCNGLESCDPTTGCAAGTAPDCGDGVECTVDTCNTSTDSCESLPDGTLCDDGQFCNGLEVCNSATGCTAGAAPDCNDGIACTIDACDEDADGCANLQTDAACDDGLFCNGTETCDPALDCLGGVPPCDDGVGCTLDSCSESADLCSHDADDLGCNDGLFCNGTETCDAALDCTSGPPPGCDDGLACTIDTCDSSLDDCVSTADHGVCDDGDACNGAERCDLDDGCIAGAAPSCDDGLFCNGQESCDPAAGCQSGVAPCVDGIGCTTDSCDEGADECVFSPHDIACDDGVFCNGAETCDSAVGCVAGLAPTCDDGVGCTADACDAVADACTSVPADAYCDDADVCNGAETCDAALDCRSGTSMNCDDGNPCTLDSCDGAGGCSHAAVGDGTPCDDGNACTVADICEAGSCSAGAAPDCDDGNVCTVDACDPASGCANLAVADGTGCDDADVCNGTETCQAGACSAGPPPACDDGRFCNGVESCDPTAGCLAGSAPCHDGVPCTLDSCNEVADSCSFDPEDLSCIDAVFCNGVEYCDPVDDCQAGAPPDCNDGIGCTVDSCNEPATTCDNIPDDGACQDGDVCDGTESCDAALGCQEGPTLDCDDGNACTVDSCDGIGGCLHTPVADGTSCADGDACTTDDTCQSGTCTGGAPPACDDGLFCNGAEGCDPGTGCTAGTAPECDDGVGCTVDACDENADACGHATDDAACDNGLFCDGTETCDDAAGCQAGAAPDCSDGIECTLDACSEADDTCSHDANDDRCSDGDVCNGAETCDAAAGCQAGTAPDCDDGTVCTTDTCDAAAGCSNDPVANGSACADGDACNGAETCQAGICTDATPLLCDDGNACTSDSCDAVLGCQQDAVADGTPCLDQDLCNGSELCLTGTCTLGTALACDDGRFCNGAETCDAVVGCQAGIEPCEDGVGCTLDTCIEATDSCDHAADDLACMDAAQCNGTETCDPELDCQAGPPPDCDDGIACTADSCDAVANECDNTPHDELCDDGDVCDGLETCNASSGCESGTPLTCDDGLFCNGAESCDAAAGCQAGEVPCQDGVSCTADTCDEIGDACDHAPDHPACDDGAFCNGAEICDPLSGCIGGVAPDCADGVSCTVDACDEDADACDHVPDAAPCQDGDACNGTELCDDQAGCVPGAAPSCNDGNSCTVDSCDTLGGCTHQQLADGDACDDGNVCTVADQCAEGLCVPGEAIDCDDDNPCTLDSCDALLGCVNEIVADGTVCEDGSACTVADTCQAGLCAPGAPAVCDDGLFCNGAETCDDALGCRPGVTPCDDDVICTVDACNEAEDSCSFAPDDSACDDGTFCNGAESCDELAGCQGGAAPDCNDGIDCTVDSCDPAADACTIVPDGSLCNDGLFCNGPEFCNSALGCTSGAAPDCSDGTACTIDVCDEDVDGCTSEPSDAACDDGLFCNGAETCDSIADCQPGSAPLVDDGVACTEDSCDEDADTVVNSTNDAQCDDGAFCNGAETCDAALDCQAGTAPTIDDGIGCTDDSCDEDGDAIVHAPNDGLCDDALHCNGTETCDTIADCQAGSEPDCDDGVGCTEDACDEAGDVCVNTTNDALCDNGTFCDGTEVCDPATDCEAGPITDCDDGVGCTEDACDEAGDVCVNTVNDALCDNGAFCDGAEVCDAVGDCGTGTPTDCDDLVGCTEDACDELGDACVNTANDELCNDGAFCNGAETCNATSDCQSGTAPDADDGVSCTDDSCDEDADAIVNTANDGQCDDGAFCNGTETCDAALDCQAGTTPTIDDGVACTDDSCDEDADSIVNAANDVLCDDGLFCNGAEACDAALDCLSGSAPNIDDSISCTDDSCDEDADIVVNATNDALCDDGAFCNGAESCDTALDCQAGAAPDVDDGVSCTDDSCDEDADAIVNTANDGLCDDGAFCNGPETCDATSDCVAGTAPGIDDGVACTDDSCDEDTDTVVNATNDALCDDGAFCNGAETCDAISDCQAGTAPTIDDGTGCTDDSCDEDGDAIVNAPNDALCDDGAFCNGAETCDATSDCQAGVAPSIDDGVSCTDDSCDEDADAIVNTANDGLCDDGAFCNGAETCDATSDCVAGPAPSIDDGVSCTDDSCDEDGDIVVNTPNNGLCDDGAFCNGAETCNATLDCQAGTAPPIDDGIGCTDDSCDEDGDAIVNAPNDDLCDDGAFCNGAETCDATSDCQPGEAPSIDDGVACTEDSCDEDTDIVVNAPSNALCDDGAFCNGDETCDVTLDCQAGEAPSIDDGVACTEDSCDEDADIVVNAPSNAMCDDGAFCNGTETCDALSDCQAGTAPAIDDGVTCTDDSCDEDADIVVNTPNDGLCDDGDFCNGAETCDATLDCQAGTAPAADDGVACTDDSCDEDADAIVNATNDSLCDDGAFCNGAETCDATSDCQAGAAPLVDDGTGCTDDSCDEDGDTIVNAPNDALCDDGAFCNGAETCDATLDCQPGTAPSIDDGISCTDDSCDEDTDTLTHTASDAICDDGLFCNGAEACDVTTDCQPGTAPDPDDGVPCTDDSCDEELDALVNVASDASCDDGLFCNGVETCDTELDCRAGTAPSEDDGVPCTDDVCDEASDAMIHVPDDASCQNGLFCDGDEICDPLLDCQPGPLRDCGDGVDCTTDVCEESTDSCSSFVDDLACEDGDVCNGLETCDATQGCLTAPGLDCDDGNPCTDEICDSETGCGFVANAAACDDGLACTIDDVCSGGTCTGTSTCAADQLCAGDGGTCQSAADVDADGLLDSADPCPLDSRNVCFGPVATDTVAGLPIRLNANVSEQECSGTKIDCQGNVWMSDFGYNQPGKSSVCSLGIGEDCVIGGIVDMFGCEDEETEDMFQCDHWDTAVDPELAYSFDVVSGLYLVNMYFANTYPGTADVGDRVFDITCEGQMAYDDFDQVEAAGGSGIAVVRSAIVRVTDGTLDLELVHQTENPTVKAIEVLAGPQCATDVDCDDGSVCTGIETCVAAACVAGVPLTCDDGQTCNGQETCDPVDGCLAGVPVDCDDGVGCTADVCNEPDGSCAHVAEDGFCSDGAFCNGNETCDAVLDCQPGTLVACDDGIACTLDFCDDTINACAHGPIHGACADDLFCNGTETCDAALGCQPGVPLSADDGVACTADACDEIHDTITNVPDAATCQNGLLCDGAEICDATLGCVAGLPADCDDGVACTIDSCDEGSQQCTSTADDALCDNRQLCDGVETCNGAAGCQAGTPLPCDDGVDCTVDTCDDALGCTATADDATCQDDDVCNGLETCDTVTGCQAGSAPDCDDGSICTDDGCDAATGCEYTPASDGTPCDDGDVCGQGDTCQLGTCTAGTLVDCDDGDACTVDDCSGGVGCIHTPASCDDDNACTTDSCAALDGCINAPLADGTTCGDADVCNGNETCLAGLCDVSPAPECDDALFCNGQETCDPLAGCQPGAAVNCDDGVDCTADSCSEDADGCDNAPLAPLCDNSLVCDGDEICDPLLGCQPGLAPDCSDGVACTVDVCDEATGGCDSLVDHGLCDNTLYCDGIETCDLVAGCLAGSPVECDDAQSCTLDACNEDSDVCEHAVSCPAGESCGPASGDCEELDTRVWIPAATDPSAVFDGAMTTDTLFALGDDDDPAADSLVGELAYPDSATSSFGGGSGDQVSYVVDVPHAGQWYAWGRFYYPGAVGSNQANSFLLSIDGGTTFKFGNNKDYFQMWHWDGDGMTEAEGGVALALGFLEAGLHTLVVEKREVLPIPPRLDVIALTPTPAAPSDAAALAGLMVGGGSTTTTTIGSTTTSSSTSTTLPGPCTIDADCDNGLFCDGVEVCDVSSGCEPGPAIDCDDGIACTADHCDEATDACDVTTDDSLCDDGDQCNGLEACEPGGCAAGIALDCDDGNPCTDDSCDSELGCMVSDVTGACNDGINCTVGDVCLDGLCVGFDSCAAGATCNFATGQCDAASDSRVWIAAASDPTVVFAGAMTATGELTGGADDDPSADSLADALVFADSPTNAFGGGSGDQASYTIVLPEAGAWYLWARLYYPGDVGSNQANSFLVTIDGGPTLKLGNNRDLFQLWHWDGDGSIEIGDTAALPLGNLAAGPHEIVVEKREVTPEAPRIDVLMLTQDPATSPTDVDAAQALGLGDD